MESLGTNYGGWYIPENILLNNNSIIYSAGVGEDISFDLLLSNKLIGSYEKILFLTQYDNKFFDYFHNLGFKNLEKLDLKIKIL